MPEPKRLPTGVYLIDAPCPRCGKLEEILVGLRSVLTLAEDDIGQIRVKLRGKAREHDCGQHRLHVEAPTLDTPVEDTE